MDDCKVIILGYPGKFTSETVAKLVKQNYVKAGFDPNNFFIVGKSDPFYDPSFFLQRAETLQTFIRNEIESGSSSLGLVDERDRVNVVFEDISDSLSLIGSEKLKMLSLFGGVRVMIFLMSEKSKPVAETYNAFCKIFPRASVEYIKDLHTQEERDSHAQILSTATTTSPTKKETYRRTSSDFQIKEEAAAQLGPSISHKVVKSELTAPQVQKTDIQNATIVVQGSGILAGATAASLPFLSSSHTEIKDSEAIETAGTTSASEAKAKIDPDIVLTDYKLRTIDTKSSEGGFDHVRSSKVAFSDIKDAIPSSLSKSVNDVKADTATSSTLTGPSSQKYHLHTVLSDKMAKLTNILLHQNESRKAALQATSQDLKKSIPKIQDKIKEEGPGVTISNVDASTPVPSSSVSEEAQIGKPIASLPPQSGKPLGQQQQPLHKDERVEAAAQKFGIAPFDRHIVHVEDDTTFDIVCALLYKLGIPHATVTKRDSLETQYKMIELVFNKNTKHSEKYMKVLRRFRRSLQRVAMEKKAAQKALNKQVKKLEKKLKEEEAELGSKTKTKISSEMAVLLKETTTINKETSSSDSSEDSEDEVDDTQAPWILLTNTVLQYRPKYVSHLHIIDGGNIDKINSIVDAIYLKESCTHNPKLNIIHHIATLPHKNPTHHTGFKELLENQKKKEYSDVETSSSTSSSSSSSDDDQLSTCCPSDSEATCCGEDGPSYEYEATVSLKERVATKSSERRVTSIRTSEREGPKSGIKIRTVMETTTVYPSKPEGSPKTYSTSKRFRLIPCQEFYDYYGGTQNFVMSELDDVPSSKQDRLNQYYSEYRNLTNSKQYDYNGDPFYHYYDRLRTTTLLEEFKRQYDIWGKIIASSKQVKSKDILY